MLTARIYGTKSPDYKSAKFVPVWLFTRNNRVTPTPPKPGQTVPVPWTQQFPTEALPHCVLVRNVSLDTTHARRKSCLSRETIALLRKLPGSTCHATIDGTLRTQLRKRPTRK